jgi:hypothetical protein
MGIVVDGRSAAVKASLAGLQRLKNFHLSAQGVEKGKGHGFMVCENTGKDKG